MFNVIWWLVKAAVFCACWAMIPGFSLFAAPYLMWKGYKLVKEAHGLVKDRQGRWSKLLELKNWDKA